MVQRNVLFPEQWYTAATVVNNMLVQTLLFKHQIPVQENLICNENVDTCKMQFISAQKH